jgi:Family of unknown function (DUF5343)
MPLQHDGPAPYGPPRPVLQVIERFRDRGLQTPLTTEVLAKAGVTESLVNRTLQTLKLLDLIEDDGNPSEALRDYAKAPEDEAKARFAEMVRGTYAPIFSFVDPASDPPGRIRDAFRSYEPRGQQDRMVILFLGLCEYAGIISEVPKRTPGPKPVRAGSSKPRTTTPQRTRSGVKPPPADRNEVQVPDQLPDAVKGIVRELAVIGPTWTKDRRDAFMKVWEAVVDFSYPVREPEEFTTQDNEEADAQT